MNKNLAIIGIVLPVFLLKSCNEKGELPVLDTNAVSNISYTTAASGGIITNEGTSPVSEKGICWSTSPEPTINDNKTIVTSEASTFTVNITGLNPDTKYYIRAWAVSKVGTGYGNEVSFFTLKPGVAVLTTSSIGSITGYTATCGGNITDESGSPVTGRGVCWSTQSPPTIENNKTSDGHGPGAFSSSLTGLMPGTTYYLRAYAINVGTAYGNEITFTTNKVTPGVTTGTVSEVKSYSALTAGNVTSNGGADVTDRGICWSTSHNPVLTDNKKSGGTGCGTFSVLLPKLRGSTTYYIRAYATNSVGTSYGDENTFTTAAPQLASVNISQISSVSTNSSVVVVSFENDGGSPVISRGVCWNTIGTAVITDNKTTDGQGSESFDSNLTGLTPNTLYYIRAYAVNEAGTSYGNELVVKTYTGTVTDADGNIYYTVTIGGKIWMAENLRTTKYRNGDPISTTVPANLDISAETAPKYQWSYEGNESNAVVRGRLYTYYVATDNRNICPSGWHLSTTTDWFDLENYLSYNGYNYDGSTGSVSMYDNKIAKSMAAATSLWRSSTQTGTPGNIDFPLYRNKSGFTAFPAGMRFIRGQFAGRFDGIDANVTFWATPEQNTEIGNAAYLDFSKAFLTKLGYSKNEIAVSLRCVAD